MEIIRKYFPDLNDQQIESLQKLDPLYREWNEKINVISRKDIDNLYEHHILHAMAIAKVIAFKAGAEILDLGTGGGLPGIPLAILFPDTRFTLIDGTRKKIQVVEAIRQELDLRNVSARHIRAEALKQRFDFVVCRAVASLDKLVQWSRPLLKSKHRHVLPNGLITLKGGDIKKEIEALPRGHYVEVFPIADFFEEAYYTEKYVLYVQG